ncbi:HelD family protein [Plantactinospora siamensis]|uniref:HelD family protein n=1 Tax=Plantactinospora siamensis TaxID=555372 RepID=A0ABV6NRT6_9ACTN
MSRQSGGTELDSRPDSEAAEIAHEQTYVSNLYDRLDDLRDQAEQRRSGVLRQTGGTQQERSQRDSTVAMYTDQVERLNAVENGLCFGRLDPDDGPSRYIGRIGIFAPDVDHEPLLVDWRAPAARPFYLATAAAPTGIRRRRHIRTRFRTVTGVDDEVLDLSAGAPGPASDLTGEASLLAAVTASRTGRMGDIVQTIQAEQDRVIRADLGGVLVVQGGPGTGKTAVALHRAAYLLYTYRQQLSTRGVLIVGPNTTFLRYISHVLPSLAETGVLLATLGDLFPGVRATAAEPAEVAEVKGRAVLADVLAAAVRDRQRVPDRPMAIPVDEDVTLELTGSTVEAARERVRRAGRPHNLAREQFEVEIVHALAAQLAERIGTDPYADDPLGGNDAPGDPQLLGEADLAEIRRELRANPAVRAALDELWPVLTAQQLLGGLFGSAEALDSAASALPAGDRALLLRSAAPQEWTPADVPLLDEAAELLGEDDRARRAAQERERRRRIAYAEGALEIAKGSESYEFEDQESEILAATDLIDADRLADRHTGGEWLSTAQRAAADRQWAFGHVIVDEAQELSAMAWRLLMRRCPSRSMTVVGDVAQTGALAGAASWAAVLEPYVADRWRQAELTVSYRTPREIMAVAAKVLADIDPALEPPRAVRDAGVEPWDRLVPDPAELPDRLIEQVRAEVAAIGDGRLGVIVPAADLDRLAAAVAAAVPDVAVGNDPDLVRRVVVLTVPQAKGLEFDSVLVTDPDGVVSESRRGLSDLYVALTRATQRLGVLRPAAAG